MEIGPVVSDKKIFTFFNIDNRENKPRPLATMFFWLIEMARTILVEDHQRNISAKLYGNRSSGFWQEDF